MNMKKGTGLKSRLFNTLAKKMAVILSLLLIVVFLVLSVVIISTARATITDTINSEFNAMSEDGMHRVQNVIDIVTTAGKGVENYMQIKYEKQIQSAQGQKNVVPYTADGEGVEEKHKFFSGIYDIEISENGKEIEQYLTETCRSVAATNPDIAGMGVGFEPFAFEPDLRDYGFYIGEEAAKANESVMAYDSYDSYSQELLYASTLQAKTMVLTDPYEYEGYVLISCGIPFFIMVK